MTKRTLTKLFLTLGILVLFGSSYSLTQWWRGKQGAANALAPKNSEEVQRIVAMSPSTVEMVYEMGLGHKVVAVSRYTTYPPEALDLPKVGALTDVNYEQLVLLKPDCVIVLDSQSEVRKKLSELGIQTVEVVNDSVEGILDSFSQIAAVCGNVKQAQGVEENLAQHIHGIKSETEGLEKLRVLVCIHHSSDDSESITIIGNDGYHRDLVAIAGGENAYQGAVPFPKLSRENLITLAPDVIIDLVSSPVAASKSDQELRKSWDSYGELKAVQEGNIIIANGSQHFLPGPRFTQTLDLFHQELTRIRQKP